MKFLFDLKFLKDSCSEFDELWMIDEKSYLIVSPGKSKDEITQLVNTNLKIIENFRFIYKQDIITLKFTWLILISKVNQVLIF